MIIVTSGEPAGIGPDVVIKLAQHKLPVPWVVLADLELLRSRAKCLGLTIDFKEYLPGQVISVQEVGQIYVWHIPLAERCDAGQLNPKNAAYVIDMLKLAVSACVEQQFTAMVTAPVHKALINQAGIAFAGHTELLAELTNTKQVVMMLANSKMRVALATIHLPLSAVPQAISELDLGALIKIINADLQRRFAIKQPQIYIAGLNPHAGEGGYLGREEITILEPTLQQCRAQGINVYGPLPADSLFTPQYLAIADVFVAMYHDQGLPVLKYSGFNDAVNITLGLPIIRTSVDHGTALSLAGTGSASEQSLKMAVIAAHNMRKCENDYQHHCRTI